jgi:hypothetical protein
MDFTQNKLSRKEWETIEVPISESESQILSMIIKGYTDVNIRYNETQSLFSFMKITQTPEMEYFLYKKYFEQHVLEMLKKYGKNTGILASSSGGGELKSMKSADSIRIQNLDANIQINKPYIFEFLLLDLCKDMLKQLSKQNKNYASYLYTLIQLKKTSIHSLNKHVMTTINAAIKFVVDQTDIGEIISRAHEFIEQNKYLLKYEDKALFSHQKELFTILHNNEQPKLILYTAPTGTGKTLSPIGLTTQYRVIFVCVARHIGLALAKSAISMEKKVAFAFGCETASDVRLHYFSAVDYIKNRRSGGIGKVDNSNGTNVEIMICDVQSYITAMHYMLAFNHPNNIIMYWDEPTITMDYPEHELHATINKNWTNNLIPTVVLSCATLPSENELQPVFADFRGRFEDATIHTITSFDCKKSIPILNKSGFCELPHYMYSEYADLVRCAQYCDQNKTLLRYFDLSEIIRFIEYINLNELVDESYSIEFYFDDDISTITMNGLKVYYLNLLMRIEDGEVNWPKIYKYMMTTRRSKYANNLLSKSTSVDTTKTQAPLVPLPGGELTRTTSVTSVPHKPTTAPVAASQGILITTADAYTLTDGPTIFLVEDVLKIGTFYIQQSKILPTVFQSILSKITKNDVIIASIESLEQKITFKEMKSAGPDANNEDIEEKSSHARESGRLSKESQEWMTEINKLRKQICMVSLDPTYVPNTIPHQERWSPMGKIHSNAFVANIGEDMAKTIMLLEIDNQLKVLLLLGIGVFMKDANTQYMEIMKHLADEQRLFIIIASTDYIYGTNYQFCHGFIGKDLQHMTQQKTLQALGRIGRGDIQQDYTIRFRDDEMLMRLFQREEVNLEANNMCRLFCSDM